MRLEELTDDAIDYIFDNIEYGLLTLWEQSFVESIKDQWERKRRLSDRQKEILGKVWNAQP